MDMDSLGGHSVTDSTNQLELVKGSIRLLTFAHKCPVKKRLQLRRTSRAASRDTEPELESIQRRATHLLSCMTALSAAAFSGSSLYLLEFGEQEGEES